MKKTLALSTAITFIIVVIAFIVYDCHEHHLSDLDSDFAIGYKKVSVSDASVIDHGYPIPSAQLECYKQHGMYVKNPKTNHWIKLTIDRGIPFYVNRHMSRDGWYDKRDVIQDMYVPHTPGFTFGGKNYTLTDTLATCTADGRFFIKNVSLKEATDYTRYENMGLVLAVFLGVFLIVFKFKEM